jgi:putative hydrolase of the HAD superfamily
MLGIITNRVKGIHAEMHQLGLDLYFDFFLTGGQLGAYKPDRAIFDKLLSFIGRPAHEIMYIGDNYYADIVGSRSAGMHPVLVDTSGIYEDADCTKINSITDLPALLQLQPTP